MKIAILILIALLAILAAFSGIAKITLVQNEVEFFGQYGFSNAMLIVFGAAQLAGGIFLPWRKTRFAAAAVIAGTFLVSLVMLLLDGNIPVSIVTAFVTFLLLVVMKLSWKQPSKNQNES